MTARRVVALVSLLLAVGCGSDDEGGDGGGSDTDAGAPFPAPVADDCITDVSAGLHTLQCEGLDYRINIPSRCLEAACGVILDLHGKDMTGEDMNAETNLVAHGETHGYIVVQPTANLTPPLVGTDPAPGWDFGKDPPLLFDFVQRTLAAFHADAERVHATGFSQGGAMTGFLRCAHPDLFASVAPSGAIPPECDDSPTSTVDVLYMHGTADALADFDGAASNVETLRGVMNMDEGEVLSSDDDHTWTRYRNPDGTVLEFIEHDYSSVLPFLGGHCFPGSTSGGVLSCQGDAPFAWGQAVIDFFVAHPRD